MATATNQIVFKAFSKGSVKALETSSKKAHTWGDMFL